ncbi:hypothetical protein V8F06_009597 [Rhypophila decipiens]
MEPLDVLSVAASVTALCQVAVQLLSRMDWDIHKSNSQYTQLMREVETICSALDLIRTTLNRPKPSQIDDLRDLLPTIGETVTPTRTTLEEIDAYLDRIESEHRTSLFDKRRWEDVNRMNGKSISTLQSALQVQNNTTQILLRTLRRTIPGSDLDRNPFDEMREPLTTEGRPANRRVRWVDKPSSALCVDIQGFTGNLCAPVNTELESSFIHPRLLNLLWVGRETDSSNPTDKEVNIGQYRSNDDEYINRKRGRWMDRTPLSHTLFILAALTAYFMGKGRYDYLGDKILEKSGRGTSHIDPPWTQDSLSLIAGTASTSLLLTLYHYILVKQGKDRDLLVFALVGVGIIGGRIFGLDGQTILLCVAPWCAIIAFGLCAYAPPRTERISICVGTEWAGEA